MTCGDNIDGRRRFTIYANPVGTERVEEWAVCQACYLNFAEDADDDE